MGSGAYYPITFQRKVRTSDGAGGYTDALADFINAADDWATIRPLTGRERDENGRTEAVAMYRFKVRNRSDVDEGHVIVWQSETYNIRQVHRMGARALYLELDAERGVRP